MSKYVVSFLIMIDRLLWTHLLQRCNNHNFSAVLLVGRSYFTQEWLLHFIHAFYLKNAVGEIGRVLRSVPRVFWLNRLRHKHRYWYWWIVCTNTDRYIRRSSFSSFTIFDLGTTEERSGDQSLPEEYQGSAMVVNFSINCQWGWVCVVGGGFHKNYGALCRV